MIPHSLDVFLRKHFIRLRCKLTYSSCKRLFFSIFFQKICKENHSCSRLLQIKNRHAEFISSSYCLHSFSVFPIGNTPFVHIVYSSTTHVNGYSFRLDISYGNISFVLRTHRVCKENHSCSRLLQIKVVMQNLSASHYMFTLE